MPQKRLYFAADEKLLAALSDPLRRGGFALASFEQQAALIEAIEEETPDVVLLGSRLSDGTALGAFRAMGEIAPPTMVILNPGQQAFRAGLLKAGVADVAVAPVRPRALAGRLIELAGGRRRNELREYTEVPIEIDAGGQLLRGTMLNVSRDGLGVKVDGTVPDEIAVPILVKPPSGATLKLYARLVHTRTDGETVHAGMRLIGLTDDEESVLLQIAKAYASSDVPLVIEKRLPKSEPLTEEGSEKAPAVVLPMQPPAYVAPTLAEDECVEWPVGVPSLIQTLEHLRYGVDWAAAKDLVPQDAAPARTELEEAAIRFAQGLSALERQAFAPDPEILVIDDDTPVTESPAMESGVLSTSFATMLCVGAAHRFRALLSERQGRVVLGQASVRRGLSPFLLHGEFASEMLVDLRNWAIELQGYLYDAQLARDRDRVRVVQSLQDLAAKQALALSEMLESAKLLVPRPDETSAADALSRVS